MLRAILSGVLNLTQEGVMKRKQLSEERIAVALRQAESGTAAGSAKVRLNRRRLRFRQFERPARHRSLARVFSSPGNFASNSASAIPNAPAVALFDTPNAIIARAKRRSASPKFEAPHLSASSAPLMLPRAE
jgi:hypothetical protein